MFDDINAKIHLIICIGIVLHVLLEMKVLDIRGDPDVIIPGIDLNIIIVFTIDQGGIGKKPAVENMVPAEGACYIAIIDAECVPETQIVLSEIAGKIKPVLVSYTIVRFGVDVIKIQAVLIGGRILRQLEEYI